MTMPPKRKMTWGEFKASVEAAGATDEMEVSYIDWQTDFEPLFRPNGPLRFSIE